MTINQVWAHLGCKLQLLELSHTGTALQSPQHRKKRATSTRNYFCDAGTVLAGRQTWCPERTLQLCSPVKPLNNFIEVSVYFTTGFCMIRVPLALLNSLPCSKGCRQCWEQCWLLGSAVIPWWSWQHTASLEGQFVSQVGGKASKSEHGLCPLSEGDLRATTACQPSRTVVRNHRALCSLLHSPASGSGKQRLHGAGTMTRDCSDKLFKLWEPSWEPAPEANSWTEVWPGLTPAQSLYGHVSVSRLSLFNTVAGQGVTDQVKYQTFISGWQIKCVLSLSQWKEKKKAHLQHWLHIKIILSKSQTLGSTDYRLLLIQRLFQIQQNSSSDLWCST